MVVHVCVRQLNDRIPGLHVPALHNSTEQIITVTKFEVPLSSSVELNSIINQGTQQPGSKRERKWSTTPTAPLGAKAGSATRPPGC